MRDNAKNFIEAEPGDTIDVEARLNDYNLEGIRNLVGTNIRARFVTNGVPRTSAPMTYTLTPEPEAIIIEQVIGGEPPYTLLRDGEIVARNLDNDSFDPYFRDTGLRQSTTYRYEIVDRNQERFAESATTFLVVVSSNAVPTNVEDVDVPDNTYFEDTIWLAGQRGTYVLDEVNSPGGDDTDNTPAGDNKFDGDGDGNPDYEFLFERGKIRNVYLRSRRPNNGEGRIESFWGYVREYSEQELPEEPGGIIVGSRPPNPVDGTNGDIWIEAGNTSSGPDDSNCY